MDTYGRLRLGKLYPRQSIADRSRLPRIYKSINPIMLLYVWSHPNENQWHITCLTSFSHHFFDSFFSHCHYTIPTTTFPFLSNFSFQINPLSSKLLPLFILQHNSSANSIIYEHQSFCFIQKKCNFFIKSAYLKFVDLQRFNMWFKEDNLPPQVNLTVQKLYKFYFSTKSLLCGLKFSVLVFLFICNFLWILLLVDASINFGIFVCDFEI